MEKKFLVFLVVILCMNHMVDAACETDEKLVGHVNCDCGDKGAKCSPGDVCTSSSGECLDVCNPDEAIAVQYICFCIDEYCTGDIIDNKVCTSSGCLDTCDYDTLVNVPMCSCKDENGARTDCIANHICSLTGGCLDLDRCIAESIVVEVISGGTGTCDCNGDGCGVGNFCSAKDGCENLDVCPPDQPVVFGGDCLCGDDKCISDVNANKVCTLSNNCVDVCKPNTSVDGAFCFCKDTKCDVGGFCSAKNGCADATAVTNGEVGCTDPTATNQKQSATFDDGDCTYKQHDECRAYTSPGQCDQQGDYLGCLWDGEKCKPCMDDDVKFMLEKATEDTCQKYVSEKVLKLFLEAKLESPEKMSDLISEVCDDTVSGLCPRTCGTCHYRYCDNDKNKCLANQYCDNHDKLNIAKHQNRLIPEEANSCWPLASYCIYDDALNEIPSNADIDCSECNDGIWIGGEIFASCNDIVSKWGHAGLTCNILDILTGNSTNKACAGCDLCISAEDICVEINYKATCNVHYDCEWKEEDGDGVEGCVCGDFFGVVDTCLSHSECFYNDDKENIRFPGVGCFNTLTEHIKRTGKNVDQSIHEVKKANGAAEELNQVAKVLYNGLNRNEDNIQHLQEKIGKDCNDYDTDALCDKHSDEQCLWDDAAKRCVKDKCIRFSMPYCHIRSYCYWTENRCHDSFREGCMNLEKEVCRNNVENANITTPACVFDEGTNFRQCKYDCTATFLKNDVDCEKYFGCTFNPMNKQCSTDVCANHNGGFKNCVHAPRIVLGGCGWDGSGKGSCTRCGSIEERVKCNALYGCLWEKKICTPGYTDCNKDFLTHQDCEDTKKTYPDGKQCHWNHRNQCTEYIKFSRVLDEIPTKRGDRRERE